MLTEFVFAGSSIERGTEPRAAWWDTKSQPLTAWMHVYMLRMSPSIKVKFGLSRLCSMFFLNPVLRSSRQTTSWFLDRKWSIRLLPMKPAPPVIKIFIDFYSLYFLLDPPNKMADRSKSNKKFPLQNSRDRQGWKRIVYNSTTLH